MLWVELEGSGGVYGFEGYGTRKPGPEGESAVGIMQMKDMVSDAPVGGEGFQVASASGVLSRTRIWGEIRVTGILRVRDGPGQASACRACEAIRVWRSWTRVKN